MPPTSSTRVVFVDADERSVRALVDPLRKVVDWQIDVFRPWELDALYLMLQDDVDLLLIHGYVSRVGPAVDYIKQALPRHKIPRLIPTYIMSGVEVDENVRKDILSLWRQEVGSHLDIRDVLAKPIKPGDLLPLPFAATKQDPEGPDGMLLELLHGFQQPARLLLADDSPPVVNANWTWNRSYPKPSADDDGLEFTLPQEGQEIRGRLDAYRLKTSRVNDREIQVATVIEHRTPKLNSSLEALWAFLSSRGFTRMRYYTRQEVPESPGVLSLRNRFGSPELNLNAEWEKAWRKGDVIHAPLDDYIATRFDAYEYAPHDPGVFEFKILDGRQKANFFDDDGLQFWSRVTGLDPEDRWLEFPILCRNDRADGRPRRIARALVIADCKGRPDSENLENAVERNLLSFRTHCAELARLLEDEAKAVATRHREQAREFFLWNTPDISAPGSFDEFLDALARKALATMEAEVATVCWLVPTSRVARIVAIAIKPDYQHEYGGVELLKTQLRLVNEQFTPALVEVLTTGQPMFRQDPTGSGKRHYPRCALPLKVGDKVIGAVGFMDRRARRFNQERVEAVQSLLELAAVMIGYVGAEYARREWEGILMHQVHRLTGMAQWQINDAINTDPDERKLRAADWFLDLLLDQYHSITHMHGRSGGRVNEVFDPSQIAIDELERANLMAASYGGPPKRLHAKLETATHGNVHTEKSIVEFIVRTLIDNAFDHGDTPDVYVEQEFTSDRWVFEIINGGGMSEEADRLKFVPFAQPASKKGSHTALAYARNLSEEYNAALTLTNGYKDGIPVVITRLEWPLILERTSS